MDLSSDRGKWLSKAACSDKYDTLIPLHYLFERMDTPFQVLPIKLMYFTNSKDGTILGG